MEYTGLEIAIIGMAGRFPGASNIYEYWSNLKNGVESITFFSDEELLKKGVKPELLKNPNYVKANGVLNDKDLFDAAFFGYTPNEAHIMVPQMRLLHEVVWGGIEDAGYIPTDYDGKIGLYLGASSSSYWELLSSVSKNNEYFASFSASTFTTKDQIATRIAYMLNLKGPAIVIDTACSTSLVAVHLACQALLAGECDMAVAGGISLFINNDRGYLYNVGDIYSPDGHCRAFDEKAKGTVCGEGVGVVTLKPLENALRDNDNIYAIIKGSAINNDGKLKIGYTAPGAQGQAAVIRSALLASEVDPETISYIEAHGTGTEIGDPIEIEGLKMALNTQKRRFCKIGSVKTNIGHLIHAAGVASLIKTALCLKYKLLPPTIHFNKPNPKIDFENSPFFANDNLVEWDSEYPLRAGVSSFGIGGTNAHIVLEQAPVRQSSKNNTGANVIILSAKNENAVQQMAQNLSGFLKANDSDINDVAYTLQIGRKPFEYRAFLPYQSKTELIEKLSAELNIMQSISQKTDIIFMFPGQGAQYPNMGYDLYNSQRRFRELLDECFEIYSLKAKNDIRRILFPKEGDSGLDINKTEYTQPITFIFEYVLAKFLMEDGVTPNYMIGHSIGEYVAACIAGAIALEDAIDLITYRAKLMQSLPEGMMLSVELGEDEIKKYTSHGVYLAAVNSTGRCVISGSEEELNIVKDDLTKNNIQVQVLKTSHAFHSGMMEPILEKFKGKFSQVRINRPHIPYISNLTGDFIKYEDISSPDYWCRHLRHTVLFEQGIEKLLDSNSVFIEIGAGKALGSFVRQHKGFLSDKHYIINLIRHPKENVDDNIYFLKAIGQLWQYGIDIKWNSFYQENRLKLSLPTYPFQTKRYWIEDDPFELIAKELKDIPKDSDEVVKNPDVSEWFYIPVWKRQPIASTGEDGKNIDKWLFFTDDSDVSLKLTERMKAEGNIVVVKRGGGFEKLNGTTFKVNPSEYEDYKALINELCNRNLIINRIVNMWCISEDLYLNDELQPKAFYKAQDLGFYCLINTVKAIKEFSLSSKLTIYNITNEVQEVTGEENIQSHFSPVLSPIKNISQEFSNIRCKNIDIKRGSEDRLLEQLYAELKASSKDYEIAYRGKYRYTKTYEKILLKPKNKKGLIISNGIYLIAGGVGYIGMLLAEYLIKSYNAKVALTTRKLFPKQEKMEQWLSQDQESIQGLYCDLYNNYLSNRKANLEVKYDRAIEQHINDPYEDCELKLNKLCASYIYSYFKNSGINTQKGYTYRTEELAQKLNILPQFKKFLNLFIHILVEEGILKSTEGSFTFIADEQDIRLPDLLYNGLRNEHPEFAGTLDLLDYCVKHYSKGLTGITPAVGILFPEGNTNFIEKTLEKNSVINSNTLLYLDAVKGLLSGAVAQSGKKVRILEVGGGSGQLTEYAISGISYARMSNENIEYCFTDISTNFVKTAEEKAKKNKRDFMRFKVFDISKEPAKQGFELNSFDIILGYDVVHATPFLTKTLKNLKSLLTPNGLLILLEDVKIRRWVDMVWGFANGWWAFEDDDIRQLSPIAPIDKWKRAFEEVDFSNITIYPQAEEKQAVTDAALIIGQQGEILSRSEILENNPEQVQRDIQRICEKIRRIKSLQKYGADILVENVDIAEEAGMIRLVNSIENKWGRVNGVIHAAGETKDFKTINDKDMDKKYCERFFIPKVEGLFAIDRIFRGKELDFCLFMSSISSVLGGLANTAYAAGNIFMDSHIKRINQRTGSKWISVNWSAWPNWLESELKSAIGGTIAQLAMTPDESFDAVERVLSFNEGNQIVQFAGDLHTVIKQWLTDKDTIIENEIHYSQENKLRGDNLRNSLQEKIITIWQRLFGIEEVGLKDNFFEIGGDSLKAISVISIINKELKVDIPLSEFFNNPTIEGMESFICNEAKRIDYLQINPAPRKEYYETSSIQKRLFSIQQMNKDSTAYNETMFLLIDGKVNVKKLEEGLIDTIRRHEALRTSIEIVDNTLKQKIYNDFEFTLQYYKASIEGVQEIINSFIKPFDLGKPPLIRAGLIEISEDKFLLMQDVHHIATDLVSSKILLRDILLFYKGKRLGPLELQYKDFAEWQSSIKIQMLLEKQKQYWLNEYGGDIPVLSLPYDYPRPIIQSFEGDSIRFYINEQQTEQIKEFILKEEITLYMLLLSAYSIMLSKLSNQDDILVGTPVIGRRNDKLWDIMGMFVNTLGIRTNPKAEKMIISFLNEVKEKCLLGFENQEYQLQDLVSTVIKERDSSRNPIFDVMFVLLNAEIDSNLVPEVEIAELKISEYNYKAPSSKFDITFSAKEERNCIEINVEYCTKLFKKDSIKKFIECYKKILKSIVTNPQQAISDIEIILEEEKKLILNEFNNTAGYYPENTTIIDLFEKYAIENPENIVVVAEGKILTYKQLSELTSCMAYHLREQGVKPNTIVGIMVDRSIYTIVGILSILKAGAAYLPINPNNPQDRINSILEDSNAQCLLAPKQQELELRSIKIVNIDKCNFSNNVDFKPVNTADDLAYVIYTSGTTGKPKGIMVTHKNVINLVWGLKDIVYNAYPSNLRVGLIASYEFDASVQQIFGCLLSGHALYIVPDDVKVDGERLVEFFNSNKIDITDGTPTHISIMLESNENDYLCLKHMIIGGEALSGSVVNKFYSKFKNTHAQITNIYGPTECCVDVSYYHISRDSVIEDNKIIPIGKPMLNERIYILDNSKKLQPIGIKGEIYIDGLGVSKGYLNNREMTNEKFISNPFIQSGIIYKTGDIGSWLPDGNIVFWGRNDFQIKLRGFRIELVEIEKVLCSYPKINSSVVVVRNDNISSEGYICAYYVSDEEIEVVELQTYLLEKLPQYMLPSYFMRLHEMPLTRSGKIDRAELPEPQIAKNRSSKNDTPRDEKEGILADIWKEVLNKDNIGVCDNFFMLGGDSIKIIQITSKLLKHGYKIGMHDFFKYPTIDKLSFQLKKEEAKVVMADVSGIIPLTPIQHRFFKQHKAEPNYFNQSILLYFNERLDEKAVRQIFSKLQEHHDSLRIVFEEGIVQRYKSPEELQVSLEAYNLEWVGEPDGLDNSIENISNSIQAGISLENNPLMKLASFRLKEGEYLLIAIHHLVVDAVSWRILLEDLGNLFTQYKNGEKLEIFVKTNSYKDWATNLEKYAQSDELLKEKGYWRSLEAIKFAELKADFDGGNLEADSSIASVSLTAEETALLTYSVNKAYNTNIEDILLTTLGLSLKESFEQNNFLIALEGHGREELFEGYDFSHTVGWFTSIYPLCLGIPDGADISTTIRAVKEGLRKIPNRGIGYGILKYLTKGGASIDLKPSISFNYLGEFSSSIKSSIFSVSDKPIGYIRGPNSEREFILDFSGLITDGVLKVSVIFSNKQFEGTTIDIMLASFRHYLSEIISHCVNKGNQELTPSDFDYRDLTIEELDALFE